MILSIKVKPGSKVDQIFYDAAGLLTVKIKAPAQEGKANAYLIDFLAKRLGVAKANVTVVAGFTSPHKRIELNVTSEVFERFLSTINRT
ncbi:DUF167 domain-containing protein [Spirosoma sp. KUDC1026]|uniref:DUF167 domain-containing protein n=1 Tax=Spirosoma sp. KUDC1026 TaxID=2745947 RepID=UPI00159B9A85|nr:DUF167 domain-containing protein [Spirosoma sp. KUDC1026]QKZ15529.1 DUF167 domain-containing protein [Spirosoma sp. KUDC1026]